MRKLILTTLALAMAILTMPVIPGMTQTASAQVEFYFGPGPRYAPPPPPRRYYYDEYGRRVYVPPRYYDEPRYYEPEPRYYAPPPRRAEPRYYPPRNGRCQPGWTVQDGLCKPYRGY